MLEMVWVKTKVEPTALENQPSLPGWLAEYYKAFRILSTRRHRSMDGLQPISLTDVLAYVEMFGTIDDDLDTFVGHVIRMDSTFLKFVASNKPDTTKAPDKT